MSTPLKYYTYVFLLMSISYVHIVNNYEIENIFF